MFNKTKTSPKLNPDQILQKEFDYISQTAFQANEDRSRFTSFYLVSTGSLVAAIVGTQMDGKSRTVALAFFILFVVLTAIGALTLAQLARLRIAWHESVKAMNRIKEFYIANNPEIEDAFRWRTSSIPQPNKPGSIANLTALEVTLLSALTAGASLYFLLSFIDNMSIISWMIVLVGTISSGFALWFYYISQLKVKE